MIDRFDLTREVQETNEVNSILHLAAAYELNTIIKFICVPHMTCCLVNKDILGWQPYSTNVHIYMMFA